MPLQVSPKQSAAVEAIRSRKYKQILLIGALGTSKSFLAAVTMLSLAKQYPGSHIGVARRHMPELKRTTYLSFVEAAEAMGVEYVENKADMFWLIGTSRISFVELNPERDPQMTRIKSINLTAAFIDEADGVTETGYITLFARTGRANKNGAPDFFLAACNPNTGYLKTMFYEPWRADRLPKDMAVVEFTVGDSFLSADYYSKFNGMPRQWRARYLENLWDFEDDTDSLFKYRHFTAGLVDHLDQDALRTIGYDVARSGKDRSVCALWYGRTLADIVVVKASDEQLGTDEQGEWLATFMADNAVLATNVSVDGVGLGVGVIDHLAAKGIHVNEFVSGGKPSSETYDKLRSEVIYRFSQGLADGTIHIYVGCPYRNELLSEAMAHNHKTTDKRLAVESKEEVKKRTGSLSPDLFDAVVMGLATQTDAASSQGHKDFLLGR